jgi:hypothetical protein
MSQLYKIYAPKFYEQMHVILVTVALLVDM